MNLIINGEDKKFNQDSTLQAVIVELKVEEKVMAAAVNMEIVKKNEWENYILKDNDKLELLQFVGGGWLKSKGDIAEKKASTYLVSKGFKIIEQNFYAKKLGEIDIIASKDNILHFIEVKSALEYEIAINNLTSSKLSKLKRSVDYYLQTKKIEPDFCIDAIIVVEDEIDFLENITF